MSSYKNIKGKGTQMFYYWESEECKCHCHHKDYKGEYRNSILCPCPNGNVFFKDCFTCQSRAEEKIDTNSNIQKLPKRRGVKLSSTVAGQRELIREMRNKMDEVIDAVNELRGKKNEA